MEGSFASRGEAQVKSMLRSPIAQRGRALLRNRIVLFAIGPILLLLVVVGYLTLNAGVVSTDDATVSAARVAISPEVRGRIIEVKVHDNQRVHAGDVLLRLDDHDYRTAVADATAKLNQTRLQVSALRANYQQAVAQAGAAQASASYAQREATRQHNLLRAGVASQHDADNAAQEAQVAQRNALAAQSARLAALANLGGAGDINHHPLVVAAQAALDQANSDLADTIVKAPRDGVVARVDQIQIGSYTQPAQALFWLISGDPWVDAAFKEDQLEKLQPGQPVQIHVDAFPHEKFRGHVVSLSPGTGSSFSILPSQNGSGNWVKVVQRLTVRVAFDDLPPNAALATGLSASVRVDTKRGPPQVALRGRED